jgi:hypothetical protein
MRASGVSLSDGAVALLHERTEGWAAGLRLAAISLAEHPDPERFVTEFSGSERTVAGYLLAEVLERQPAQVRELLLRTSVLSGSPGRLRAVFPLSDGMRARRFPVVNVTLIAANFAAWIFDALPHLGTSVHDASFHPCSVDGALPRSRAMAGQLVHGHVRARELEPEHRRRVVPGHLGKNVEDSFGASVIWRCTSSEASSRPRRRRR